MAANVRIFDTIFPISDLFQNIETSKLFHTLCVWCDSRLRHFYEYFFFLLSLKAIWNHRESSKVQRIKNLYEREPATVDSYI